VGRPAQSEGELGMDDSTRKALGPHAAGLAHIASELRTEVAAVERSWRDVVGHAIRAGELLLEAKAAVGHGEWLPWLEANFPGSERTARNYMRLATNRQHVADLPTVREAIATLTETSDAEAPRETDIEARIEAKVRAFEEGAAAAGASPRLVALEAKIVRADETVKAGAQELLAWANSVEEHPAVASAATRWAHLLLADPSPFELVEAKAEAREELHAACEKAGLA
jgi:hypothetical protein